MITLCHLRIKLHRQRTWINMTVLTGSAGFTEVTNGVAHPGILVGCGRGLRLGLGRMGLDTGATGGASTSTTEQRCLLRGIRVSSGQTWHAGERNGLLLLQVSHIKTNIAKVDSIRTHVTSVLNITAWSGDHVSTNLAFGSVPETRFGVTFLLSGL